MLRSAALILVTVGVGALTGCGGGTTTIIQQAPTTTTQASSTASPPGGSGVVEPGKVGPLIVDVSGASEVEAFAGSPEAVYTNNSPVTGKPDIQMLGYGCTGTGSSQQCETYYWLSKPTGKLVAFNTQSPSFTTTHGTRVGMSGDEARGREPGAKPYCVGLLLASAPDGRATLDVLVGGRPEMVDGIEMEGDHTPVGTTSC